MSSERSVRNRAKRALVLVCARQSAEADNQGAKIAAILRVSVIVPLAHDAQ